MLSVLTLASNAAAMYHADIDQVTLRAAPKRGGRMVESAERAGHSVWATDVCIVPGGN